MDMIPGHYEDEVVFTPELVAKTAVDIINWCQTSPRMPKLGGRDMVGPEQTTVVILAGKTPETGPKPPGHPELRMSRLQTNSTVETS